MKINVKVFIGQCKNQSSIVELPSVMLDIATVKSAEINEKDNQKFESRKAKNSDKISPKIVKLATNISKYY